MNIVFLGTPDFSSIVLESLIKSKHKVVGVVTQIDKKVGRKQILTESPVKILAKEYDIPVFQFNKIRSEGFEPLKELNADIFITCAYGQIISQEILDLAKFGTINVHFSLLPKYRGASPVQCALVNGEKELGVTIMRTDAGIDTGDMICQKSLQVEKDDNAETLLNKLSFLSCDMLLNVLDEFENGTVTFTKQGNDYTYFSMLKKEDGKIDFVVMNAEKIVNLVKGLYIWPNAYAFLEGKMLKIFKAEVIQNLSFENAKNGEIVVADKSGLVIKCNDNTYLKVLELQLEGSKRLDYKSFLNGNKNLLNKVLD